MRVTQKPIYNAIQVTTANVDSLLRAFQLADNCSMTAVGPRHKPTVRYYLRYVPGMVFAENGDWVIFDEFFTKVIRVETSETFSENFSQIVEQGPEIEGILDVDHFIGDSDSCQMAVHLVGHRLGYLPDVGELTCEEYNLICQAAKEEGCFFKGEEVD